STALEENSQKIFAFEWEDLSTGRRTQLCWTVLPQGFKNSPTIFGAALTKELQHCSAKEEQITLLQCVDDILLGADTTEICKEKTVSLLSFLGMAGYRLSEKKAPLAKQTVIYLGFEISQGQQRLGNDREKRP
ncbi:POK6 protein, partial [Hydrobates tethys]|nr:POK6 protein [Oceanodroma tethys]